MITYKLCQPRGLGLYWNVSIQKHLNKLREQVLIFGVLRILFFIIGKEIGTVSPLSF